MPWIQIAAQNDQCLPGDNLLKKLTAAQNDQRLASDNIVYCRSVSGDINLGVDVSPPSMGRGLDRMRLGIVGKKHWGGSLHVIV